jgi:hypothetical protein
MPSLRDLIARDLGIESCDADVMYPPESVNPDDIDNSEESDDASASQAR